jgi:hypothetical protein
MPLLVRRSKNSTGPKPTPEEVEADNKARAARLATVRHPMELKREIAEPRGPRRSGLAGDRSPGSAARGACRTRPMREDVARRRAAYEASAGPACRTRRRDARRGRGGRSPDCRWFRTRRISLARAEHLRRADSADRAAGAEAVERGVTGGHESTLEISTLRQRGARVAHESALARRRPRRGISGPQKRFAGREKASGNPELDRRRARRREVIAE